MHLEAMIGKPGEAVPVVEVEDIKAVYRLHQELGARHPGKQVAVGMSLLQSACPEADIRAVAYRCSMLQMLERLLQPAWDGGQLSENSFKAAAKLDLEWMPVGVVKKGLPLDLEMFLSDASRR